MAICCQCGNDYDKSFTVIHQDQEYHFDCMECAIQVIAPACAHCGCKIIGHGVESDEQIYCCAHCAQMEGITTLNDRDDDLFPHELH